MTSIDESSGAESKTKCNAGGKEGRAIETDPDLVIRESLQFMWAQYKNAHLPNLIYSVGYVSIFLTVIQNSQFFKALGADDRSMLSASLVFMMFASGLAMIHRFTSQLFLEVEIFPESSVSDKYYLDNKIFSKVSNSYAYSSAKLEFFRGLHNVSKVLTSVLLYMGWMLFICGLLSSLKTDDSMVFILIQVATRVSNNSGNLLIGSFVVVIFGVWLARKRDPFLEKVNKIKNGT